MRVEGMLYRYDDEKDSWYMMLQGGEIQEFQSGDWSDLQTTPKMGQKVVYEKSDTGVSVKLVGDESDVSAQADEEQLSIDEHAEVFVKQGFNLIKDISNDTSRTITLRTYSNGDFSEVVIQQSGERISVNQTVNGQAV